MKIEMPIQVDLDAGRQIGGIVYVPLPDCVGEMYQTLELADKILMDSLDDIPIDSDLRVLALRIKVDLAKARKELGVSVEEEG